MTNDELISWLLEGDVSIQYQVNRDLLKKNYPALQRRIEKEGWGKRFLSYRNLNGYWGKGFYQPKWTSTHYTILDLKNLTISPENKLIKETLEIIFKNEKAQDGGIKPIGADHHSDICINGMVLNYSAYFGVNEKDLRSLIDLLLSEKMDDGGFNCLSRKGAVHSSLHTTLSVLEGILEYEKNGYTYRLNELIKARHEAQEFILMHKLFRSDKTGKVINPGFLRLCYPGRWHFDILRALDYFHYAGIKYDNRMSDALEVLIHKRSQEGIWKLASPYPGKVHFNMEKPGNASRWNTLRALRVLNAFSNGSNSTKNIVKKS